VGKRPLGPWSRCAALPALDCRGIRAALLVPGATDRDVFLRFLEQVLGPQLRAGTTIVLDNLTAHKGTHVAEAIRKAGAQFSYLPPYSPDFNPIKLAGSKIKTFLRGIGARTRRKLSRSLKAALTPVTPQEAETWFRHCGYPVHSPQICSRMPSKEGHNGYISLSAP
jgi:transposase